MEAEVEAEEARVAPCKVRRTEVFTEVFPLAIQNQVEEFRPVLKRFVSVNADALSSRQAVSFEAGLF